MKKASSDIFKNNTISLYTRDNINNYLRLVNKNEDGEVYKLCVCLDIQQLYKHGNEISVINPTGGPMICINEPIDGTISFDKPEGIIPYRIEITDQNEILIYC